MNYKKKERRFLVTECAAPSSGALTYLVFFQEQMTEAQRAGAGSPIVGTSVSGETRQGDVASLVPDGSFLLTARRVAGCFLLPTFLLTTRVSRDAVSGGWEASLAHGTALWLV